MRKIILTAKTGYFLALLASLPFLISGINKEEIKNLGKQFGIATNSTSLIVLENVQDYARYEISPPSELLTEYNNLVKNRNNERDSRMTNIMEKAEEMTEELKKWWKTEFKEVKKYPFKWN